MEKNIFVLLFSGLSVLISVVALVLNTSKQTIQKKVISETISQLKTEPETIQLLSETFKETTSIVKKSSILVVNSAPTNVKKIRIKPRSYNSCEKMIIEKQEVKLL